MLLVVKAINQCTGFVKMIPLINGNLMQIIEPSWDTAAKNVLINPEAGEALKNIYFAISRILPESGIMTEMKKYVCQKLLTVALTKLGGFVVLIMNIGGNPLL
jgi:hypothetical protein